MNIVAYSTCTCTVRGREKWSSRFVSVTIVGYPANCFNSRHIWFECMRLCLHCCASNWLNVIMISVLSKCIQLHDAANLLVPVYHHAERVNGGEKWNEHTASDQEKERKREREMANCLMISFRVVQNAMHCWAKYIVHVEIDIIAFVDWGMGCECWS